MNIPLATGAEGPGVGAGHCRRREDRIQGLVGRVPPGWAPPWPDRTGAARGVLPPHQASGVAPGGGPAAGGRLPRTAGPFSPGVGWTPFRTHNLETGAPDEATGNPTPTPRRRHSGWPASGTLSGSPLGVLWQGPDELLLRDDGRFAVPSSLSASACRTSSPIEVASHPRSGKLPHHKGVGVRPHGGGVAFPQANAPAGGTGPGSPDAMGPAKTKVRSENRRWGVDRPVEGGGPVGRPRCCGTSRCRPLLPGLAPGSGFRSRDSSSRSSSSTRPSSKDGPEGGGGGHPPATPWVTSGFARTKAVRERGPRHRSPHRLQGPPSPWRAMRTTSPMEVVAPRSPRGPVGLGRARR